MIYRPCPICHSISTRRSKRRSLFEHVVLRLVLVRPYRCEDCNHRFYSRRRPAYVRGGPTRARFAHATTVLLAVFLLIPLVWSFQATPARRAAAVALPPPVAGEPLSARGPRIQNISTRVPFVSARATAPLLPAAPAGPAAAQAQRVPLGEMRVTGEVFVNGALMERGGTVFAGDAIRTGPAGAASIVINGRGRLLIAARTEVVLAGTPRYLASLESGAMSLNAQAVAQSFQVRVGNYVVVPAPEVAAVAEIERAADGAARIICVSGSVGVIELEGVDVVFLRAGQSASISADGVFSVNTPPAPARPADQPQQPTVTKGGVPKGVIILLVAGGGAAGAAAALAGKKDESQPVSPSQP